MQITAKQGESVSFEFSSADAQTTAAMTIKDSNGATRTLTSNERVLIDSLTGQAVQDDTDPSTDIRVTVLGDYDAGSDVDAGERVWVFSGSSVFDGGAEGYSLKAGFTPSVDASGAGQVDINGTGRIIKDGCVAGRTRPAYREPKKL